MRSKLAIICHAPSDNVRRIVDALIDGASDPAIESVDVCPVQALAAGPVELLEADGVIFATTENFGYMSGALKDFFDRSYYPCLDKVDGKPYALVEPVEPLSDWLVRRVPARRDRRRADGRLAGSSHTALTSVELELMGK